MFSEYSKSDIYIMKIESFLLQQINTHRHVQKICVMCISSKENGSICASTSNEYRHPEKYIHNWSGECRLTTLVLLTHVCGGSVVFRF